MTTKPSREFEIGMAALSVAPASFWKNWMEIFSTPLERGTISIVNLEASDYIYKVRKELRRREGR